MMQFISKIMSATRHCFMMFYCICLLSPSCIPSSMELTLDVTQATVSIILAFRPMLTVPRTRSRKPAFREIPGACVKKEAFSPFVLGMLYVSPGLQLAIRGLPELYWHQFSEPDSNGKKASHHNY